MTRLVQATTSSSTPPGGPGGGPRGGVDAMRGGLGGQGPGKGPGQMMRGGADHFARHADHGDHHWWMLVIFIVAFLIIVGLMVWAIIAFSRAARNNAAGTGATGGPTAKEHLDQRLAKGDISPEDYEARRKLLDG